jgi:hypothetical protein
MWWWWGAGDRIAVARSQRRLQKCSSWSSSSSSSSSRSSSSSSSSAHLQQVSVGLGGVVADLWLGVSYQLQHSVQQQSCSTSACRNTHKALANRQADTQADTRQAGQTPRGRSARQAGATKRPRPRPPRSPSRSLSPFCRQHCNMAAWRKAARQQSARRQQKSAWQQSARQIVSMAAVSMAAVSMAAHRRGPAGAPAQGG